MLLVHVCYHQAEILAFNVLMVPNANWACIWLDLDCIFDWADWLNWTGLESVILEVN